ncbi:MAG TPA: hypothetical protein VJ821_15515 [Anaerolineales bacterium]|nr:hypothetical protein [Anaerolineales bacterium]
MEDYLGNGTMICGAGFILSGLWALVLARWNLGETKLERLGLIRLSPKVNKIITFAFGIILIICGILIVRFAIINPVLP